MKKLVLLVMLLVGCNSNKPALKGDQVSAQIDVGLHTSAIKAHASKQKVCYLIPPPNSISGQYCLEYLGQ